MNSLTTLSVSRTPLFVERTSVPAARDNKTNLPSRMRWRASATARQRDEPFPDDIAARALYSSGVKRSE